MAADELRGLYLDIEVRGVESATKDIEVASTATDSLAESFGDLVTDSELAAQAIGHTEEKVESLGDSLTQTTGGVVALRAALSTLGGTQIGDVGDVDLSNTTLPDAEDRTIQQTLNRDVETNQPEVSQLDFDIDSSEFAEGAAASHLYSEGLDDAQQSAIESSIASRVAASSADEAGDEFSGSAVEALIFGRALSTIRNTAYSTIPGLTATQSQIDEVGDEANSSTAQVLALRSALQGLGGSSQIDLGPFNVSIWTAILAVGTLIPLVLSLGAALSGLAVAGLGVAGVLGGALAGGMMGLADQVGGMENLLTEFKSALEEALEPLTGPIFQDFALGTLRGAVKLLSQFATFAEITFKELTPLIDAVSGAFWDNTPEFFAALNYSITELAPILADFMTWFAEGMPSAIRLLTDTAKDVSPALANLGQSIMRILPPLIELGTIIFNTLAPALAVLIDGLNLAVSAFNMLPDWAQSGIILAATAIFAMVGAISLLGSAISGIIGIVGTFVTILQIGGLIYNLVGGVGILSTVLGGLSTVLSGAATAVTGFLAAIGPVGWAILALGAGIAAYQTNFLGFKDAVDSTIGSLIEFGQGIVHAVLNPLETLEGVTHAILNPLDTLQSAFEWFDDLSLLETGFLAALPGVGPILAVTKGVWELFTALQSLSNIDVVDVAVNLIKQGAEDLWNWLTPDIGGFQKDMQKLGEKINKQYQNLSPEEKKKMEVAMDVSTQILNPLGNLLPDIDFSNFTQDFKQGLENVLSNPPVPNIPQIDLSGLIPDIPQVDFSNLIPDIDLPQIDLWGGFADNFPRTAREIREETQLLKSYWEGLKVEAGDLKQSFDNLIGTPIANFFEDLTNIPGDLKEGFDNLIGTPIANWWSNLTTQFQQGLDKFISNIQKGFDRVTTKMFAPLVDFKNRIQNWEFTWPDIPLPDIPKIDFGGVLDSLKTGLDVGMATLIDPSEMVPKVAGYWYQEGISAATSFIDGIQSWIFGGLESTWDRLTPNVGSWFSDGKSAADTLIDGILSVDIGKKVGNWLKGLIPFMPGSDAQTGPLSNLTSWGKSLGQTIISGIKSVDLQQAAKEFLSGIGSWVQNKAKGIEQTWNQNTPNLSLPDISLPDMPSLPDIPSMGEIMPDVSLPDMPDVPDLPSIDDLTPSIQMPDMPSVDLPSVGELMPSVSMPNIPSPSLPDLGSMIPSVQMPDMGGIQGAIPNLGPILGGNPLGGLTTPNPAPMSSTSNKSVDNRNQNTNVNNQQNWEITIEEADSPQQVRKEIEKASGLSAKDILGALQGHNNS